MDLGQGRTPCPRDGNADIELEMGEEGSASGEDLPGAEFGWLRACRGVDTLARELACAVVDVEH